MINFWSRGNAGPAPGVVTMDTDPASGQYAAIHDHQCLRSLRWVFVNGREADTAFFWLTRRRHRTLHTWQVRQWSDWLTCARKDMQTLPS